MAPHQPTLSLDNLEIAAELVRRGRRAWIVNALSLTVALLGLAVAFVSFSRPLPVVVKSDDPREKAQLLFVTGDSSVREVDARRFVARMGELLMGWSSATVRDDANKATLLMTAKWRKVFTDQMNHVIDVPESIDSSKKATQFYTYIAAQVRNSLEWDWDQVICAKTEGVWNCKAPVVVETQPLVGPPSADPAARRKLLVTAQFVEVPPTVNTLDGLLVDFWNQVPAP